MRLLIAAALLVACTACNKSDPTPTCAEVTDHFLQVTKQGLTGHDALQLGNRQGMVDLCEKRPFSPDARKCLLAAKDLAGIAACQKLVTPAGSGSARP